MSLASPQRLRLRRLSRSPALARALALALALLGVSPLGFGCAHGPAGPPRAGDGVATTEASLARLDELRSRTAATCDERRRLRHEACALARELCTEAAPGATAAQRLCLEAGETCARAGDAVARCGH